MNSSPPVVVALFFASIQLLPNTQIMWYESILCHISFDLISWNENETMMINNNLFEEEEKYSDDGLRTWNDNKKRAIGYF